jgi:hypothetical protein
MPAAAPARRPASTPAPAPVQQRVLVAVRDLPDSGVVVRMSRGQLWIGVLGALLAGIVALNVANLSLGTSSGRLSAKIETLERENSALRADLARRLANGRVQAEAARLGLVVPGTEEIGYLSVRPGDAEAAARRLAAGLLGASVPSELIPGGAPTGPAAPSAPPVTVAPTAPSGGGATSSPAPQSGTGGSAGGVGA